MAMGVGTRHRSRRAAFAATWPQRNLDCEGKCMKQAVIGILAHVDAGKTTLAEAMLFDAGQIRTRGRVDNGDSHLDTDAIER